MASKTRPMTVRANPAEVISATDTPTLEEYLRSPYLSLILRGGSMIKHRLLIGVPMTGTIRAEWAIARYGQTVPTNWSAADYLAWMNQITPLGYNVADARNLIVNLAVQNKFEWVLFLDSDVLLPSDTFMKLNAYMREPTIPVIFGLYCTKSRPSEPLVYRSIGGSYFRDFTLGEKFWVSGIGMGCTLIHGELLRVMAEDAPYYLADGQHKIKRVFDTPQVHWLDEEIHTQRRYAGTEDLAWCKRVAEGGYMAKAGFTKVGKRKYQFLCDSSIFCGHISPDGIVYPLSQDW
jgi:hypothetical protein